MKIIYIFIAVLLCSCNSKPNEYEYTKPSKEQKECLANYQILYKQSLKEDMARFGEVMKSKDDDYLIRYELAHRKNEERLCMMKANCYDRLKGIEFSDCLNNVTKEE